METPSSAQEPTEQDHPPPPTDISVGQNSKVLDDITRSGLSTNVSSGSGNDQTFETKDNESPSPGQGACLGTDLLHKSIDGDGISASKSYSSTRPQPVAVGAFCPDRLRRVATGHTQENIWAQSAPNEKPKVDGRNIFDDKSKYGLFGTTKTALPNRSGCLAKSEMLIHSKDGMEASSTTKDACGGQLNTISFKTPISKPTYTQSFGFSFSPKFEERPIPVVISQIPSPSNDIEKKGRYSPLKSPRTAEGSKHHSRGCALGLVQDFGPLPAAMKTSKETGDQPPILATPPVTSSLSEGIDIMCDSVEFKYGETTELFTESDDSSIEDIDGIYMADSGVNKDCLRQEVTTGYRSKLIPFPGREEF